MGRNGTVNRADRFALQEWSAPERPVALGNTVAQEVLQRLSSLERKLEGLRTVQPAAPPAPIEQSSQQQPPEPAEKPQGLDLSKVRQFFD